MVANDSPQLVTIKQQYRESLSNKAEFILKWIEIHEPGNNDRAELAMWLHKFAGSAGMYGYDDLASVARELLLVANALLKPSEDTGHDVRMQVSLKLDLAELGASMQSAAKM